MDFSIKEHIGLQSYKMRDFAIKINNFCFSFITQCTKVSANLIFHVLVGILERIFSPMKYYHLLSMKA